MTEVKKEKKKKEEKVKVPILTKIQNELKAPKDQWNNYGQFKYRNVESIESALKPLLAKYGAQLVFDEDYIELGDRIYAVENARYKDSEQEITVKGWAREAEHKKGMDESQISGSTSSYATKYALGKLFLIDDTKDPDSMDNRQSNNQLEQKINTKSRETLNQKIEKAKQFEVQYRGRKKRLVDVCRLENNGDYQAQSFLENWRSKSPKNEAAYQFIENRCLGEERA